jgi:SAM-dependent methyltransferase
VITVKKGDETMKKRGFKLLILSLIILLVVLLFFKVRDWQTTAKHLQVSTPSVENKVPRAPDVHFQPTPHEAVEIMLRLAQVKQADVVYDLGCGDGRIVIAAAKKAGCRAYGFDIDPVMVKKSRENVRKEKLEKLVTIELRDIFDLDLSKASVVTLYLLPELNVTLIPQLEKMKPGSRIVSHLFDIEGVEPDVEATVYREGGKNSKVYLWTTPLRNTPPQSLKGVLFGDEKKR